MHRVAIVAPQAVPAVVGGAENLWAGLLAAFNQMPGVTAEFISPPSPERNLAEVLQGYARFARLDVSRFDQVISTKYPAWAVGHRNQTVYIQHTLRGLYDTYPTRLGFDLTEEQIATASIALSPSLLKALQLATQDSWVPGQRHRAAEMVFTVNPDGIASVADQLLSLVLEFPEKFAAYPGPYARACVRLLDAMCFFIDRPDGAVKSFGSIANTVAKRQDYFPQEAIVWVAHHPTSMVIPTPSNQTQQRDLIVTASRLEHPKRIDMLMRAYAKSDVKLPFWIVGTGPQQEELAKLAKNIPGIEMKGRLSDADLAAAYQRALFVPFAPQDEDYGLITVEAFLSGAAVLTTKDAGGPTELVEHQISGWIADPSEDALAEGFQALAKDPVRTRQMGQAGRNRVSTITWPDLTAKLADTSKTNRKKVLVINTFPTEPTTSGGRLRMKGLYGALAIYVDIHMVSLGSERSSHHLRRHSPRFIEEVVPANSQFRDKERTLSKRVGASCGDIAVSLFSETLPDFERAITHALKGVDEVICAHPYGYPVYERIVQKHPDLLRPVIYEAHNVESYLKGAIYPNPSPELHAVAALEIRLLKNARALIACSEPDLAALINMASSQGVGLSNTVIANNGLDLTSVMSADQKSRKGLAESIGRKIALFMGSDHGPNHQALEAIIEAASDPQIQRDWDFVILGSVVKPWKRYKNAGDTVGEPIEAIHKSAPTLHLLGVVSEEEKSLWLQKATVGLNPMFSGSGTNLKLAEYAAYGLPVLSTAFGARGGLWNEGEHYIGIKDSLTQTLANFSNIEDSLDQIVANAKVLVEDCLNWPVIAKRLAMSLWPGESPAAQPLQAGSAD